MNWNEMTMSTKVIDQAKGLYQFKIGNDIVQIFVNFREADYFEDIHFTLYTHYITPSNTPPTNPNRTYALMSRIYTELNRMYLKELDKMWDEIAALPTSEDEILQCDYKGIRNNFYKGEKASDIFLWFFQRYESTCAAGDFYSLLEKYINTDGFMSKEIRKYFDIF